MPWLQLKLQMLPIIAVEINNTITEYKQLVDKIQAYSGQDGDRLQDMTKYVHMRSSIKARRIRLNHQRKRNWRKFLNKVMRVPAKMKKMT